ncbi:LppU/SCO3897 family protein [Allokutzneria oryzae]|uniref:Uncharacterized protein n=1 Tax=Allokutzneria oryzae TaxID=1378989 RepID=A0ABV6A4L0_9PSEU
MSTPQGMPESADQPAAKPKRSPAKLVVSILVPLVVIGIGVFGYLNSVGKSSQVGDCLSGDVSDADNIKKVDCGPGANFKVVGKVEDKLQSEAGENGAVCAPFAATGAFYWEGRQGGKGTFLCLEELKG